MAEFSKASGKKESETEWESYSKALILWKGDGRMINLFKRRDLSLFKTFMIQKFRCDKAIYLSGFFDFFLLSLFVDLMMFVFELFDDLRRRYAEGLRQAGHHRSDNKGA